MTEYDYSPEAYDRYMRTQQRIAKWVDQTEEYRPHFGAPEQRGQPSLLQRLGHKRQNHSMREERPRSSSSSSSSESYSKSAGSPGPMPTSALPMYLQQPTHNPHHSSSRHHSSSHHHHRSGPSYVVTSPATSPGYPYPYVQAGQAVSPGPYGLTTAGTTAVAVSPPLLRFPITANRLFGQSPSYYPPSVAGYYPQTAYPFPQTAYPQTQTQTTYPQTQPQTTYTQAQPQTAPATGAYSFYAPAPQQPLSAPAQGSFSQPQTQYSAVGYPPTIYPVTAAPGYAVQPLQSPPLPQNQKSVFYQRIFSGSGSGSRKKSSRRSH